MNNMSESWSIPWHALQRRLAETFGPAINRGSSTTPKSLRSQVSTACGSNWIVRARSAATCYPKGR